MKNDSHRLIPNTTANARSNIFQVLFPSSPIELGPGYVYGTKKLVTRRPASVCWSCDPTELLEYKIFGGRGEEVRRGKGRQMITVTADQGEVAVVRPL